jgi:Zn finger protein HypA/HybF involved in hydrogenase expression
MSVHLGWLIKLGLSISENIRAQQEIERAHALEAQARSEAMAQSQRAKAETASYKRTAYEQKIARESVAVECPNCGSTNTRIRLGSAGNCAFCGTAIRVSMQGIAYVASPLDRTQAQAAEEIRKKSGAES